MPLLILKRESRQQCRDSRLLRVCVCCGGPLALLRHELAVSLAVPLSFSPSFSPPPIFLLNYVDVSRVSIAFQSRYSPPLEIHKKNKIALFCESRGHGSRPRIVGRPGWNFNDAHLEEYEGRDGRRALSTANFLKISRVIPNIEEPRGIRIRLGE